MSVATAKKLPPPGEALPGGRGLCAVLDARAERDPDGIAFLEQPDRQSWSGRPPITWTYAAAREVVGRLAAGLRALSLPAGSPVGLLMAGGAEHALSFLAVEEAGHLPCLIPAAWEEARVGAAIEAARIPAILTQGMIGEARPAEMACRIAMRTYGLRFIGAFGPLIPDGVIGLDAVVVEGTAGTALRGDEPAGVVTFAGEPDLPVHRSADALFAATAAHLTAARIEPGERILSLLPPSDLLGLVSGLSAALACGASLETHGVFSGAAFAESLAAGVPTHLVAPGWMEATLARSEAPAALRSTALARRAPTTLDGRVGLPCPVMDVLALGEDAVLTCRRGGAGDLAAVLASGGPDGQETLLRIRRGPDGLLSLKGPASEVTSLRRNAAKPASSGSWRPTRHRVRMAAGLASEVTTA